MGVVEKNSLHGGMTPEEYAMWEVFAEFRQALWMLSTPGWPGMRHGWHWACVRNGLSTPA
jgi:hypothetical protein